MTDRTTKMLLVAIAVGLWLHVVGDWIRPTPVAAQSGIMVVGERSLQDIALALSRIEWGSCGNRKICGP